MTTSADNSRLTPSELEVMRVLWRHGRLSAREVHEAVAECRGWAYSTTRTTVERLVRKGVLGRGAFHGLHLYWPRVSRARVVATWVRDFAHGVLEVDLAPVVAMVADSGALDDGEVDELRALLAGDEGEEA